MSLRLDDSLARLRRIVETPAPIRVHTTRRFRCACGHRFFKSDRSPHVCPKCHGDQLEEVAA